MPGNVEHDGNNMDQIEKVTSPFDRPVEAATYVQIFPFMLYRLVSEGKFVKVGCQKR